MATTLLFPYQLLGAKWLASKKHALLADEMGLGKSAQAIVGADTAGARSILVLCPAVARLNWMREWVKFSSRTWTILPVLTSRDARAVSTSDIVICSYDLTTSSAVMSALSARSWDLIVADEAHYLKSRNARRTRAVLGALAGRAARVWALTGTPAPNNPAELWPLLRTFGVCRTDYWSFTRRYCTIRETPFGMQITGGRNIPELRALMAPILLRRKKEDVMPQLPKIFFSDVVVEPTKPDLLTLEMCFANYIGNWSADKRWKVFHDDMAKQQTVLETLAEGIGMSGDDGLKVLQGLEAKVKSLRRWVGIQKVPKIVEMIRGELEAGAYRKVVIFAVHRDTLLGIRDGLKEFGSVLLFGGTPPQKRDIIVRRFQEQPECRVFCGQIVAAGTAVTLTAAHHVVVAEADWTPANNAQAVMRCHRIGQTKPVTVRFVGMANSIDEKIQKVLRTKTRTLTQLFDEPPDIFAE